MTSSCFLPMISRKRSSPRAEPGQGSAMATGHVIRLAGPWECQLGGVWHQIKLPGEIPAAAIAAQSAGRIAWRRRFHSPTRLELLQQVYLALDASWGNPDQVLLDGAVLEPDAALRWVVPLQYLRETSTHQLEIRLAAAQVQLATEFAAPVLILEEQ